MTTSASDLLDLVVRGASVLDVGSGDRQERDVAVVGGRVVEAGGGAREVVDGRGCTVVPLVVHTLEDEHPGRHYAARGVASGNAATFAVVSRRVGRDEATGVFVVRPPDLRAVVVDGRLAARDGEVLAGGPLAGTPGSEWLADWHDRTGHMVQTLDDGGRYDETRAGRRHAWTGRYWVHGSRIVYLDDTGFFAFGELDGDVLHHAGFVMDRG